MREIFEGSGEMPHRGNYFPINSFTLPYFLIFGGTVPSMWLFYARFLSNFSSFDEKFPKHIHLFGQNSAFN